jgi:formylglycine-generating enzyme required for sulfatase activity
MKRIISILAVLMAASCLFSCKVEPVAPGTVGDLSPYANDHGTYTVPVGSQSIELIPVAGGSFTMGQTPEQGIRKTPDIRRVFLDGFAISKLEVTQALWKEVMGSNPSPRDIPAAPVSKITWDEAVQFTARLAKKTGIPFRLPTEAEWEFAARGGNASMRHRYSGSDTEIGAENELGIKAMSGGVWEWCSDFWRETLETEPGFNPTGPESGSDHVLRGGSAADKKADCVISSRRNLYAKARLETAGLRVAVSTGEPCPQALIDLVFKNEVPRDPIAKLSVEVFNVNGFTFKMMPVEGGTFQMGGTDEQGQLAKDDEKPVHAVTLDSFMIGQYEVTGALWNAVMGYLPPNMQADNKPVGNISWYDAQAFIKKLNELTGRKFRLPTEAEWEYVARGGRKSHGYVFAGAGHSTLVAQCDRSDLRTCPVGKLSPNELGTYDMSGNAWEYCQDRYATYPAGDQVNPKGPEATESGKDYRVARGGSAAATWDKCRVSNRLDVRATNYKSTIGFRLAL